MQQNYFITVSFNSRLRNVSIDADELITLCQLVTGGLPSDAGKFQKNCILSHLATGTLYTNTGTVASPVWTPMIGGGAGNPALPFNSIQYNLGGVFFGDALATRIAATGVTSIGASFIPGELTSINVDNNVLGYGITGAALEHVSTLGTVVILAGDLTSSGGSPFVGVINSGSNAGDVAGLTIDAMSASGMDFSDAAGNGGNIYISSAQSGISHVDVIGDSYRLMLDTNGMTIERNGSTYGLFPIVDGNNGDVITTDGAGHWTFQPSAGGLTGAGALNTVAIWDSPSSITYDALFTYDPTDGAFEMGSSATGQSYIFVKPATNSAYFELEGQGLSINASVGMLTTTVGANGGSGNLTRITLSEFFDSIYANTALGTEKLFYTRALNGIVTSFGWKAGNAVTLGTKNAFFGEGAGERITVGENNAFFGYESGGSIVGPTSVNRATLMGASSFTGSDDTIAIGYGATANTTHQAVIGSNSSYIDEYVFYRGTSSASSAVENVLFRKTNASGTDVSTSMWNWHTGDSTGDKDGGPFVWYIAKGGAPGNTVNLALSNEIFRLNPTEAYFSKRTWRSLGSAVAANNLVADNSNTTSVSGNTQINGLDASWGSADPIYFIFTGTPTLKHNTAPGAAFREMLLAGSVDFTVTAGTVMCFVYDLNISKFREVSRSQP